MLRARTRTARRPEEQRRGNGATRNVVRAVLAAALSRRRSGFLAAQRHCGSPAATKYGHVVSLCNLVSSLYCARLGGAAQLQDAYAAAATNADVAGCAHAASIIAGMYLAWGDSDTALAYAIAPSVFRKAGREWPTLHLCCTSLRASVVPTTASATRRPRRSAHAAARDRQRPARLREHRACIQAILIERGDFDDAEALSPMRYWPTTASAQPISPLLGIAELRLLRERKPVDGRAPTRRRAAPRRWSMPALRAAVC